MTTATKISVPGWAQSLTYAELETCLNVLEKFIERPVLTGPPSASDLPRLNEQWNRWQVVCEVDAAMSAINEA